MMRIRRRTRAGLRKKRRLGTCSRMVWPEHEPLMATACSGAVCVERPAGKRHAASALVHRR